MMKKVYICAPLGGDVEENLQKVKQYTKYALVCGTAPVVPQFYAECLNDRNPKEREIGLQQDYHFYGFAMKCGCLETR